MNTKLGILTAAVIIAAASSFAASPSLFQSSYAWVCPEPSPRSQKVSIAVLGDKNVYVVWFTDKGTPTKMVK